MHKITLFEAQIGEFAGLKNYQFSSRQLIIAVVKDNQNVS